MTATKNPAAPAGLNNSAHVMQTWSYPPLKVSARRRFETDAIVMEGLVANARAVIQRHGPQNITRVILTSSFLSGYISKMSEPTETLCTAFDGDRRLTSGALPQVALAVKMANRKRTSGPLLIFDDANGRVIDIDTRGTDNEMLARIALSHPTPEPASRGKGRPKLGVVAREITLLPRHWEWLSEQPGGASVMLRKLVDEARRSDKGRLAHAKEATYRFMSAMAGNLPQFEEAIRALFANDQTRFESLIAPWPCDIRDHIRKLSASAFAARATV